MCRADKFRSHHLVWVSKNQLLWMNVWTYLGSTLTHFQEKGNQITNKIGIEILNLPMARNSTNERSFTYTPQSYLLDETKDEIKVDEEESSGGTEYLTRYKRIVEEKKRQIERVKSVNQNVGTERRKQAYLSILKGGFPNPNEFRKSNLAHFDISIGASENETEESQSQSKSQQSNEEEEELQTEASINLPEESPAFEETKEYNEEDTCSSDSSDSYGFMGDSFASDSLGFRHAKRHLFKDENSIKVPSTSQREEKVQLILPLNLMCKTNQDRDKAWVSYQSHIARKQALAEHKKKEAEEKESIKEMSLVVAGQEEEIQSIVEETDETHEDNPQIKEEKEKHDNSQFEEEKEEEPFIESAQSKPSLFISITACCGDLQDFDACSLYPVDEETSEGKKSAHSLDRTTYERVAEREFIKTGTEARTRDLRLERLRKSALKDQDSASIQRNVGKDLKFDRARFCEEKREERKDDENHGSLQSRDDVDTKVSELFELCGLSLCW